VGVGRGRGAARKPPVGGDFFPGGLFGWAGAVSA